MGTRVVKLTHLDKLLFPTAEISKRQLIDYYLRIADQLLPHLRDRAIVTRVFPRGVAGPGFWRRSAPEGAPRWIPRWRARPGTPTICPLIQEPAALVWFANQGVIEIHPWHSRRDRPTMPDWAVLDLDPGQGQGFSEAVEVAHLIKDQLDQLTLRAWLKTSGQSGLHIYIPLRRRIEEDQVRDWVGELAHRVAQSSPRLISEVWGVADRHGRLRIDYTQNVVGKTLAAVYSPRPGMNAPVSTPIDWDELDTVDPRQFTLRTVPERVRLRGDLFAPVLAGGQSLPRLRTGTAAKKRSEGRADRG